jgi:hypothetical protein
MAWWIVHEAYNAADVPGIYLLDDTVDAATENGLAFLPRNVSVYDYQRYSIVNGSATKQATASMSYANDLNTWHQFRVEWNPSDGSLDCDAYRCSDSSTTFSFDGSVSNNAALAAAFTSADRFTFKCYQQSSVYYRDAWLLGFWLGDRTDDWPAVQMPLSLDEEVGSGSVTIVGYSSTIFTPVSVVAGAGAIEVDGLDPRLGAQTGTGAVVIDGYDATVSAEQPQYAKLKFKFRDSDGVIKEYEIGRRPSVQTITDSDFAQVNDDVVLCDATTGAINLRLPQASGRTGYIYRIKKVDSTANTITILRAGADTIDGANSVQLAFEHEVISVVSDGSDWWIV